MSRTIAALLLSSAFISSAFAASSDDILAANKAAMGDWSGKNTLRVEYAYSGQGLTGTTASLTVRSRTETPARCTVSGSPETRWCHQ